ncbi:ribosomal RNA processing protein 1 homolog A-like [Argopecten irradians]|uniref:ribosomal RNA processing protein 1 homolog A-like n=1 Tax=Argopecten irradians TaxID=31199 RepID=UPI0037115475
MGEMATTVEINDSAEIHFAQRLASNRKPIRDRALKKLRKWLEAKSNSNKDAFCESDFVKIWKGLHYCLWMQDKPLLQEELTERITQMVHVFGTVESSLLFVKVFFQTEAREWDVLDKWRVDKFMTLTRRMLNQTLLFLKNKKWRRNIVKEFTSILSSEVMSPDNEKIPQGLRIHLADIYLAELEKVGAEQLSAEQVLAFLQPFFQYLPNAANHDVMKRVVASVFEVILKQTLDDAMEAAKFLIQKEEEEESEIDPDDLDLPVRLQYDYKAIADQLFQLGSSSTCPAKNRTLLYDWVKKFRDLEEGAITREEDIAPGISKRLKAKKKKKRTNKKRKGSSIEDLDNDGQGDTTPSKKLKPQETTEEESVKDDDSVKVKKDKKKSADMPTTTNDKNTKKKKKKSQKSSETEESGDVGEEHIHVNGSDVSVVTSIKKKGQNTSDSDAKEHMSGLMSTPTANLFDVDPQQDEDMNSKVFTKTKNKRSKKGEAKSEGKSDMTDAAEATTDLLQEEVEIWIPNKKYMKKHKANMEAAETKSPVSKFAKFDANVLTPPAFLRKAVAKATPKSVSKVKDQVIESETPTTPGSRKRVSFNMNKNKAKEFSKKTLIESTEEAFNPSRTPDQGILKTTPSSVRSKAGKNSTPKSAALKSTPKSVAQKSTPKSATLKSTPSSAKTKSGKNSTPKSARRPKATDFF